MKGSFKVVSLCLFVLCYVGTGNVYAQCSGFPATTADADCAGGTTLSSGANINSGQSYGFCGPNSTTYTYSNVNLSGGTLRICGKANLTGTWNSGVIVVSCGATANFTSGLTLNSNVGIINYGTINVTGDINFQNNNNWVYNETSTAVINVSGNITFAQNNGQNGYLKNSGYIKVNGTVNALEGSYVCFMDGGTMEAGSLKVFNNCATGNRWTFGSSSGSAILRYTGSATLNAPFTSVTNWKVYKGSAATQSIGGCGSWGSAVISTNTSALSTPAAQSCTSVSTCWSTLASTGLSLSAHLDESRVELDWSTQTESNTDYFDVQRSSDGKTWERLTTVAAKGNSSTAIYYKTYDNNPGSGTRYYRVILTSLDGMENYSTIVTVNGVTGSQTLSVYPNPGTGSQITLSGWSDYSTHVFMMYNSLGQRVYSGSAQNGVAVGIPRLAKGIYFIVADNRRVSYIQE